MKYHVATPIESKPSGAAAAGPKKTRWAKIGRAWSDSPAGKITVILDALPFRSEFIYLFPEDQGPLTYAEAEG